jgi:hypothetical protein
MKKLMVLFTVCLMVAMSMVSCSKSITNGPLCAQGVRPTATNTPTPDSPYTVYLHQEATPMASVGVTLIQPTAGITLYGVTDSSGKYVFNVHCAGQWELDVKDYDSFEGQKFMVEPLVNTYNAINYGIPSLEVQLVSGSETIPMAASTIVYEVIYHTKFPRPVVLSNDKFDGILISNSIKNLRIEGDDATSTINIPKSYEGYPDDDNILKLGYSGSPLNGKIVYSPVKVLTKGWGLEITANFIYAAVKAYNDNYGKTSYYAGINITDLSKGTYMPKGNIVYDVDSAANTGDAGAGSLISTGYGCFDNRVGYGCYTFLAKLNTDKDEDFAYGHPDNNGTLIVRIHDDANGDLDVKRAFFTNNQWSMPCYWTCCTSNTISPQDQRCTNDSVPFPVCHGWDNFRIAFAYKERTQTITSYKK